METVQLPHLPGHPLRIGLFKDVKNARFLRQQLLEGNTDFEYAFLDAAAILSRNHVLAACFRAINDMENGRMKSRNVHSEVVFSLSPNNNVSVATLSLHSLYELHWVPIVTISTSVQIADLIRRSPNLSAASASRTTAGTSWQSKSAAFQIQSTSTSASMSMAKWFHLPKKRSPG